MACWEQREDQWGAESTAGGTAVVVSCFVGGLNTTVAVA
jgi:hypothetical protein